MKLKQGIIIAVVFLIAPFVAHTETIQPLSTVVVPQQAVEGMGFWTQCDFYNMLDLLPHAEPFTSQNEQQQIHSCAYWSLYKTVLSNDRYKDVRKEIQNMSPGDALRHVAKKPIDEYPWIYLGEKIWMPLRPDWEEMLKTKNINLLTEIREYLAGTPRAPPPQLSQPMSFVDIEALATALDRHERQIEENRKMIAKLDDDVSKLQKSMEDGNKGIRDDLVELEKKMEALPKQGGQEEISTLKAQVTELTDRYNELDVQALQDDVAALREHTRTTLRPWYTWLIVLVIVLSLILILILTLKNRKNVQETADDVRKMRGDGDKKTSLTKLKTGLDDLDERVSATENDIRMTTGRVSSIENVLNENGLGWTIVIPKVGNPTLNDLRRKEADDEFVFIVYVNNVESTILGRIAEKEKQVKDKNTHVYLEDIKNLKNNAVKIDNIRSTIKRAIRDRRAESVIYPDPPMT